MANIVVSDELRDRLAYLKAVFKCKSYKELLEYSAELMELIAAAKSNVDKMKELYDFLDELLGLEQRQRRGI